MSEDTPQDQDTPPQAPFTISVDESLKSQYPHLAEIEDMLQYSPVCFDNFLHF